MGRWQILAQMDIIHPWEIDTSEIYLKKYSYKKNNI